MGVNKLLKAGIAKENLQLRDESAKKEAAGSSKKVKKAAAEKKPATAVKKRRGGRPSNKEIGIKSRKQYSLTLKEDDYSLFLAKARENDMSFAKFMEKAAFEYIENHKTV